MYVCTLLSLVLRTYVARKKTYSIYSWLVLLTVRESMATGSKKAEFEMSADACIGVL
jgi:hypothetical protein